jgi:hypothetical protein
MVRRNRDYLSDRLREQVLSNKVVLAEDPGNLWFFDSPQEVESLMSGKLMQVLLRTQKLLSNSLFVDLSDTGAEEETVDEERVEKEAKALEEELTVLFTSSDRMISRAVMANTINKMPVFFADHKEVMDYVLYSLQRCSDNYEKAACFEIINEIMAE